MNKPLAWALGAVAALGVLAVALTLLLRAAVDPAELARRLESEAGRRFDATLRIGGGLGVSVFPTLAVRMEEVSLSTPAGAAAPFAEAASLRFGARLLPLLRGEFSISEVSVRGLRLDAVRGADGRGNWEGLLRPPGTAGAPVAAGTPDPSAVAPAASAQAATGAGDAAAAGEASATPGATGTSGAADAAPGAGASDGWRRIAIDHLLVEDGLVAYTEASSGNTWSIRLERLAAEGLNTGGDPFALEARGGLGLPRAEGETALELSATARIAPDAFGLSGARLAATPPGATAIALEVASLELAPGGGPLRLAGLSLRSEALEASASAEGSSAVGSGRLDVARLDANALARALGSEPPAALNPALLAGIGLGADLAWSGGVYELRGATLRAGPLSASGSLRLSGGEDRRIDATLDMPLLDLDQLFAPAAATAPPADASAQAAGPDAAAPPADGLAQALAWNGSIAARIGELRRAGLVLGEVDARLAVAEGSATLESLEASLYGGTLSASGTLQAGAPGALALEARLRDVELKPLLSATRQVDRFEGRAAATLRLRATGTGPAAWNATLAGPVSIGVGGVLHGMNAAETVCKAAASLNGEPLGTTFEPLTRFDTLEAALDFRDGVGEFRTLRASTTELALDGRGRIELPARRLRVRLDARVTGDLEALDPACRMTRKMQRIEWPLSCKGSFDEDPQRWCGVDKDDLAKIASQLATEKLGDKLRDKIGDFFRRN